MLPACVRRARATVRAATRARARAKARAKASARTRARDHLSAAVAKGGQGAAGVQRGGRASLLDKQVLRTGRRRLSARLEVEARRAARSGAKEMGAILIPASEDSVRLKSSGSGSSDTCSGRRRLG